MTGGLKYNAAGEFQEGVESEHAAPNSPSTFFAFGSDYMKYFVYNDPDWNYAEYNWDTFREDTELLSTTLSAVDPDLSAFSAYPSWRSPWVPVGFSHQGLSHFQ